MRKEFEIAMEALKKIAEMEEIEGGATSEMIVARQALQEIKVREEQRAADFN